MEILLILLALFILWASFSIFLGVSAAKDGLTIKERIERLPSDILGIIKEIPNFINTLPSIKEILGEILVIFLKNFWANFRLVFWCVVFFGSIYFIAYHLNILYIFE